MALPPPETPAHILRTHSNSLTVLAFSDDNERLYTGDESGRVIVTSTRSLRAIANWNAHTDGLLGVEEWGARIITHGRDNKLHIWTRMVELPPSARLGASAAVPDLLTPTLCYSMDVNALNFCRFSLMTYSLKADEVPEPAALLAIPNLIDSSVSDIWSLPSRERVHASIGQEIKKSIFSADSKGRNTAGIIMSLHLYQVATEQQSTSTTASELRLLCAYENGSVTLRKYADTKKPVSVEGVGWEFIWTHKLHVESVMAMKVSKANSIALTVSADNLIGRHDLTSDSGNEATHVAFRIKNAGNNAIALRDDGKICAIAGWDGRIRLFSTRTFKPLGTLKYHKESCRALEFARSHSDEEFPATDHIENDDDEISDEEKLARSRWLVAGSKDHRVSIWTLITFAKT